MAVGCYRVKKLTSISFRQYLTAWGMVQIDMSPSEIYWVEIAAAGIGSWMLSWIFQSLRRAIIWSLQKKKPPFPAVSTDPAKPHGVRLLKLDRNVVELGVEAGADCIHGSDDHNRNAGGNQAIFNRGRTRLVLDKRKHF